jgi:hypothetical protein
VGLLYSVYESRHLQRVLPGVNSFELLLKLAQFQVVLIPGGRQNLSSQNFLFQGGEATTSVPPGVLQATPPSPRGPHAPNSGEAKALRRLCAQSGLTPAEVRERRIYRQQLAQAANPPARLDGETRRWLKFSRRVRYYTSAAPWTPEFRAAFIALWERARSFQGKVAGDVAYARFAEVRGFVPLPTPPGTDLP